MTFVDNNQVSVVVDVTAKLSGSSEMNYIETQSFLAFDGNTDFSNASSITTTGDGLGQPIEFNINYSNGAQQKYAINVYTYVVYGNGGDRYVFSYYRQCVRQGTASLVGVNYSLAITSENNDADYSNLDSVDLTLDLNGNGTFEDNDHFPAGQPFILGGTSYVVESITPDGTVMAIIKSR